MKYFFVILSTFAVMSPIESAFAAMPPYFKPGQFQLTEHSEYFWTTSNYDEFGEIRNLTGNNSYSNLTNQLDGTYFISDALALRTGANISYAKSTSTIEDRSNSELSSLHGQVMYKFVTPLISFIPDLDITLSLTEIDPQGDNVLTGEGVNTFKVGSWALAQLGLLRLRGYGYIGYEYRDGGRSALIPWTAGLSWRGRRLRPSFEISGYNSASDDEYISSRFNRELVTSTVNAGSLRYYSVNPNLIQARAELTYQATHNFSISAGASSSLKGESTAKGESVFFALAYSFSPHTSKPSQPDTRSERQKKFEFKLEEDYDETLFEDE
ncbi:MAG: hypothetical protein KDD38_02690 [Bdellovibrionales bacterium]|nr:hypothetical protein [Bdellovibrionales bacterium]